MTFRNLNIWAILVSAVSAFVIGGLWYSPLLFGAAWKRANGFATNEPPALSGVKHSFRSGGMIVAHHSPHRQDLCHQFCADSGDGIQPRHVSQRSEDTLGLGSVFGWVAMGIGVVSLFERRPWTYVFINGGYLTVALVVMGAILGRWREF